QAALDDLRERNLLPPDLVFRVSVSSDEGLVVASTREAQVSSVLAAQVVEEARAVDDLIESPAVQDQEGWWLRFSRGLTDPDGGFGGVASVEVEASFFVSGYE